MTLACRPDESRVSGCAERFLLTICGAAAPEPQRSASNQSPRPAARPSASAPSMGRGGRCSRTPVRAVGSRPLVPHRARAPEARGAAGVAGATTSRAARPLERCSVRRTGHPAAIGLAAASAPSARSHRRPRAGCRRPTAARSQRHARDHAAPAGATIAVESRGLNVALSKGDVRPGQSSTD